MKIIELLEQSDIPTLASKEATWSQFLDAQDRIVTALDALDNDIKIYRGIKRGGEPVRFKAQMPAGYRESANTYNYYTLIMDSDPAWKAYPKRSASVIASTGTEYASHYGEVYLLIPEGDPVVGVCPAEDLWDSFSYLEKQTNGYMSTLEDLNMSIRNALRNLLGISPSIAEYSSYEELVTVLQQAQNVFNQMTPQQIENSNLYDDTQAFLRFMDDAPMKQKLSQLLDPNRNNMALANWSQMDPYMNGIYEVWFSAPTWMLNVEDLPPGIGMLTKARLLDYARAQAGAGK